MTTPTARFWGRGRLAISWEAPRVFEAILGAFAPPAPACVCDPIEGDIFGVAPALLVDPRLLDSSLTGLMQ